MNATEDKYCVRCKTTDLDELMPKPYSKGKHRGYYMCRSCNTNRHKKYRTTDAGKAAAYKAVRTYQKKNREKARAWLKASTVPLEPCEVCGEPATDRHHPDYSRPLYVKFLCRLHHKQEHKSGLLTVNNV